MPDVTEQLRRYGEAVENVAMAGSGGPDELGGQPRSRRWRRPAAAAAVLVVGIAAALVVTWSDESGDAGVDVDTAGTTPNSSPPTTVLAQEVPGEWRTLPSTLGSGTELSPFAAQLDEDRVLVLHLENGGNDVAGEIIDLAAEATQPIAESTLLWRAFSMVAWTGEEVIVAGGSNGPGIDVAGAAYDPGTDSWRRIADPPGFTPGRSENQAAGPGVWTGTDVISWQSGLAYNPNSDSWREIEPFPLAPRMDEAVTAFPGGVFVWGGCNTDLVPNCDDSREAELDDGAIYDPATDQWTALPPSPLDGGAGTLAVYATAEGKIIVAVPHPSDPNDATVAAFDTTTMRWELLPDLPSEAGKRASAMVWTGNGVIVWGGYGETYEAETDAGFQLDLDTDSWRPLPAAGRARRGHTAIWTTHGLFVAGGSPTPTPVLFTPSDP